MMISVSNNANQYHRNTILTKLHFQLAKHANAGNAAPGTSPGFMNTLLNNTKCGDMPRNNVRHGVNYTSTLFSMHNCTPNKLSQKQAHVYVIVQLLVTIFDY